jgi:hypothetical protein
VASCALVTGILIGRSPISTAVKSHRLRAASRERQYRRLREIVEFRRGVTGNLAIGELKRYEIASDGDDGTGVIESVNDPSGDTLADCEHGCLLFSRIHTL